MRWENLFDDLEGQLEYELGAEETDLKAEGERLRLGRISLRDRLIAVAAAQPAGSTSVVRLRLISGTALAVRPATFGKDWLAGDLIDQTARRSQCILPLAAIGTLDLTPQQISDSIEAPADAATRPGTRLVDRIGLSFVLRDLCRRRSSVEVVLQGGTLHGTIDRVGRDQVGS